MSCNSRDEIDQACNLASGPSDYMFVRQNVQVKDAHFAIGHATLHPSIAFNNAANRPEFRIISLQHLLSKGAIFAS
jgi:hypothetical protein